MQHVSSRAANVTEPQSVAEVSVAQRKQSITLVFLASVPSKTWECFISTHSPVRLASVIESHYESVSVGCDLVAMTPQSSFWKDDDSGHWASVAVQLFAVVKHLNSGTQKKKKKAVQANPGNHCNVEHPLPLPMWEIR